MQTIAEKRLDKLIARLCTSRSPSVRFFGINAASMVREVSTRFATMATDGKHLYVNPDWLESHSDTECCFVLIHEAFHKVAAHSVRLRDAAPHVRAVVHMAADYAVNLALTQDSGMPFPCPDEGLLNRDYVDADNRALNAERIIPLLLQDMQQIQQQDDQQQDDQQSQKTSDAQSDDQQDSGESGGTQQDSGQQSGSNTPECTGELLPAPDDYDESENMQDIAKAEVLAGEVPGYIKDLVRETLQPARNEWVTTVKHELCRIFDRSDYSLRRPNQRYAHFGAIAPSLRSPAINRVAIVIDTSASMSIDALNLAASQTKMLIDEWSPLETLIYQHDSRITYRERITTGMQPAMVEFHGRGGTRFNPVTDELDGESPDAVVWITDCYPMDKPREPDYPVIWLSTTPNGESVWQRQIGFGRYIEIA